jgi:hypothetical protein
VKDGKVTDIWFETAPTRPCSSGTLETRMRKTTIQYLISKEE